MIWGIHIRTLQSPESACNSDREISSTTNTSAALSCDTGCRAREHLRGVRRQLSVRARTSVRRWKHSDVEHHRAVSNDQAPSARLDADADHAAWERNPLNRGECLLQVVHRL